jgi:tetratricopeptide (TPR) repeat protein
MNARLKVRLQKIFDYYLVDHTAVILCLFVLALTGAIVYRNSFGVPFLFDDLTQIVFNPAIQTLEWPWRFLENNRRPLLYTTLAFDFHQYGLKTFGYHIFNVRVHILAAMSLFLLILKTCRLPRINENVRRDAPLLALGAALIWLCHPLQTQAVTYIIQRAESLMSLFFIVALYCAANYLTSRKVEWLTAAGLASLMCGLTKEVALALPLVVLLYDRAFIALSFREAIKNNRWLYLSLSFTWAVMLFLFLTTPLEKIPTAGFAIKDVTSWDYALNEPGVILHYLRLAMWPDPLIFDYQWPLIKDLAKLLPSLGIIMAGLTGLLAISRRYPTFGFLGLCFFVILSPSSSFIPLKDLICEYRMYLALGCWAVMVTLLIKGLIDRFANHKTRQTFFIIAIGTLALILGGVTNQRNIVYRTEESLWQDVLKKQPGNARIWSNLGSYLFAKNRYKEAENCFLKALSLNPASAEISANVATVLMEQNKLTQAIPYAQHAVELSPDFAIGYYTLGVLYSRLGRYEEAIAYFEKTIQCGFKNQVVLENLEIALRKSKRH